MKIIDHSVIVPVGDKHSLFVNTINGYIGVLNNSECKTIKSWISKGSVEGSENANLLDELNSSGFIVEDESEEERTVSNIVNRCKARHDEAVAHKEEAVFVVTYKCNYACPYCYESANISSEERIMTKEQVDAVFSLYSNGIKKIAFFGGEPFLPETREIVKYIISKSPNSSFSTTTNGYYLYEFVSLFEDVKTDFFVVTLDGTQKTHDQIRKLKDGRPTYERIMAGIDNALKNGIAIKIRMNVSKNNMEDCIELRKKMISDYVRYFEEGKLIFEMQPLFQLTNEAKNDLYEKILFSSDNTGQYTASMNALYYTTPHFLKVFMSPMPRFSIKYCFCDAEKQRRFYDLDGNIYSCILSLRKKVASLGTYYPQFTDKGNSIAYRNIETIEQCAKCKLKLLCGGGCALGTLDKLENGEFAPNCTHINNQLFKQMPELFRKRLYEEEKRKMDNHNGS